MYIRKSAERGSADHGWLKAKHSFSFAHYYDPEFMGFGALRVINEDRVQGGGGFDTHPHKNMEIVTYILDGALEHKDSMGNGSVIKTGDVQRMSAGTGVKHSEFNHSQTDEVHLFQVWYLPREKNIEPSYEQKNFSKEAKKNQFRLVLSPDGRDGSLTVYQDINMFAGVFESANETYKLQLQPKNKTWVQLASGSAYVNGQPVFAGDGVALEDEEELIVTQAQNAELVVFNMYGKAL